MAIKDWKKVGKNHWENKKEDEWEIEILESVNKDNYNVAILEPNNSSSVMSKWKSRRFKVKFKALKYAKAYMRKH